MNRAQWCFLGLFLFFGSCKQSGESRLFVALKAEQTGITFTNQLSESEDFNIIEYLYYYNGGGVAVGDVNNDGLPDIYFSANEVENKLYLNQGGLTFKDITTQAGVTSPGLWKTGASLVDVNGDGWLDIYQTRVSEYKGLKGHNELYLNNGDLTFTEVSKEWGVDFQGFSTHAGFFDIDNDGDVDLYLLNHSVHTPNSFGNTSLRNRTDSIGGDRIYENTGEYFVDITSQTGIYSSAIGYGLGLGFTDFNQDGFTDIYVSNDFSENDYLYVNNGDKTFNEVLESVAHRTSRFSMGNDLADLNNDGLVDIMTLDMMPEDEVIRKRSAGDDSYEVWQTRKRLGYMDQFGRNSVLMNMGNDRMMEVALMNGLYATDWSWSTLMADFNQDGQKDVFISNGIWKRPNDLDFIDFTASDLASNPNLSDAEFTRRMPDGKVSNYFFENTGGWTFRNASETWAELAPGVTNGATYADLDLDGDLDIVLNNLNEASTILKNGSRDNGSHFLRVELLRGSGFKTNMGAAVTCWTAGQRQYYENYINHGFQSSTSDALIIGLGTHLRVDSLRVDFQGKRVTKYDLPVDQTIKVDLENATAIKVEIPESTWFSLAEDDYGVDFVHQENTYWEFTREPLMPHMNAYEGPALAVGDVNNDALEDLFFGGANKQRPALFVQTSNGTYQPVPFPSDSIYEDVSAAFFDFEKDGDLDLLVVSGGNSFTGESVYRQPRLYLQENGAFYRDSLALPAIYHTGSVVAVHDFNRDGFDDVFLGSLAVPWNYGIAPTSYLLTNESGVSFKIANADITGLEKVGMVKDANWADLDGNGEKDLIVAALWQPVKVFYVQDGQLQEGIDIYAPHGWWQKAFPVDYDQDGDLDIVMGNLGLNTKLKASNEEPVRLYIKDIDGNKRLDHVLTYYREGQESAFAAKKDLAKPLSYINRRVRDYKSYAEGSLEEVFGEAAFEEAIILEAHEFRSGILINEDNSFFFKPFSVEGQATMIRSVNFQDFNGDGEKELFLAGNFSQSTLQDAPYTEGYGALYQVTGDSLVFVPNRIHGVYLEGNVTSTQVIQYGEKAKLLVLKNDAPITWWTRD